MRVEDAERIEAMLGSGDLPPGGTRSEDLTIEKVEVASDGWHVQTESVGFFINKREIDFATRGEMEEPKPDDQVTLYSNGSEIVGVDLNGRRLYLRTEREVNLSWLLFRAQLRRQRQERFRIEQAGLDAKYEALPRPLKARIDRFRAKDPEFRWEGEAYEMAAVNDAPKIARAIAKDQDWELDDSLCAFDVPERTVKEAVETFRKASWETQNEMVPDLDPGHSGNTFGGATMLAYALLAGTEC